MKNKIKQINKYFIYDVLGAVIYGIILYVGFIWLIKLSLIYGYLWNFALIILAVISEGYVIKIMQSDKTIMTLKKKFGAEKTCLIISGGFISFKTLLYFFYIFILIVSQIINFNPALLNENLVNFILANDYSILFLLAFDTLIGQIAKDREKNKKILEKLKTSIENQD